MKTQGHFSFGGAKWSNVVLVIAGLLFIVFWEWPIAFWPFQQDDSAFIGIMRPLEAEDVRIYFGTDWGWVYRPLFLVYFGAMVRWFGPDPVAFHLASIALHLGISVLLGWLCYRLISRSRTYITRSDTHLSLLCGALFFVWQGRSEPLQAASSTSTLISVFFCLAAIHAWVSWGKSSQTIYCALTVIALCASLGAKEEAVVLPLLLLILDRYFPDRMRRISPIRPWQNRAAYAGLAIVVIGFALLSLKSQQSITPSNLKVVGVPSSIEPFTIASFYLLLWGNCFLTGWGFISSLVVAILFRCIYRLDNRVVRGGFYLSLVPCLVVPLMTGTYALRADRFFYFPRLILLLAVALSLAFAWSAIRPALEILVKKPLVMAAVGAGWARAAVTMLLINKTFFDYDTSNLILDLFTDRIFIGLVSGVVLVGTWGLFRAGRMNVSQFGLVGTITLSNLLRWSFPHELLPLPLIPLTALVIVGLLFHRQGENWVEGVLSAAALWETPALSLPIFLVVFLLLNRFAATDLLQRLHMAVRRGPAGTLAIGRGGLPFG